MLFCYKFVQGLQARQDPPNAIKNQKKVFQELGTGSCTIQRFSKLDQGMGQCMKQIEAKFYHYLCSKFASHLQCMDPLSECFTTEELNRFKRAEELLTVLKFLKKGIEFKNCQQYKDFAGEGSVAGINMGILIALLIVAAYFGI